MLIINVLNLSKNRQSGITLLEVMITMIIVGILATLSIPNLTSMMAKSNMNQAFDILKATIQTTQRQAMGRSSSCTIQFLSNNIIQDNTTYATGSPQACFSNAQTVTSGSTRQLQLSSGVKITTNLTSSSVTFDSKGLTLGTLTGTANQAATIVLSMNGTQDKKCIVISPILGLIRAGSYTGSNSATGMVLNDSNPHNSCSTKL